MCLAEALLRIPDPATRDALIRDKISTGQWHEHLGRSPSLFVNAATWALLLTGKLVVDAQRVGPVERARAPGRQGRRAADPKERRPGDAPDGRAVRHRRDDRRGARQRAAARGAGLSLLVRHARRGGADRRRRGALPARLRGRDRRDRPRLGRPRRLRRAGHLDQALGAAPALQPGADRSRRRRALSGAEGRSRSARAATTSASTSTPRRPTASRSRSTCSSACASSPSSPAGTASASSSRRTRSAARS